MQGDGSALAGVDIGRAGRLTVYGLFSAQVSRDPDALAVEQDLQQRPRAAHHLGVGHSLDGEDLRLRINNLKDLEDKIIGVVVAALAVAFLGQAAGSDEPAALLNYGGGIALVIAALAFVMRYGGGNDGKREKDK